MPPKRLRCKIVAAKFLTREQSISVPYKLFEHLIVLLLQGSCGSGSNCLLLLVHFFDKRDTVDFVQGRNPGKNLLQGRLAQTR